MKILLIAALVAMVVMSGALWVKASGNESRISILQDEISQIEWNLRNGQLP